MLLSELKWWMVMLDDMIHGGKEWFIMVCDSQWYAARSLMTWWNINKGPWSSIVWLMEVNDTVNGIIMVNDMAVGTPNTWWTCHDQTAVFLGRCGLCKLLSPWETPAKKQSIPKKDKRDTPSTVPSTLKLGQQDILAMSSIIYPFLGCSPSWWLSSWPTTILG